LQVPLPQGESWKRQHRGLQAEEGVSEMNEDKEKGIKKVPIGQIGKDQKKITIADEVEIETQYHIDPPLTPRQLMECWLDPSELDLAFSKLWHLYCNSEKTRVSPAMMETLKVYLMPEAYANNIVSFKKESRSQWSKVKPKVLKRFNLTGLTFNSMSKIVHYLKISSRQPLYDQDAHSNRVRNVLRSVKIHYPQVVFEHEGCSTSGTCPIGLQEALRKLAEETQKGSR
jgi:hypothetical protein